MAFLIRHISSLFRRPKVKFGSLMTGGGRGKKSPVCNAQFVGFLEGSGFRTLNPIRHEKSMDRRRFVVHVIVALLFLGFVWIMIESAHALALF
jgi:hypothetical protein